MAPGILHAVITCHVRYEIDPSRIEAFERFARRWMELVERSFLRPLLP